MSEFIYLYRGGQRASSPEGWQQQMQKWMGWMKGLAEQGRLKEAGQPLEPSGSVVRAADAKTVTDGPFAEKDLVCGYTIVEAPDLSAAVASSAGCPIFETGGVIEVRPVIKMEM